MKVYYTEKFKKSFHAAPQDIQRAFAKQLKLLLHTIRHPSLHAKKYDEANDIWQARVTRDWRFYFTISNDTYYLVDMMSHPK